MCFARIPEDATISWALICSAVSLSGLSALRSCFAISFKWPDLAWTERTIPRIFRPELAAPRILKDVPKKLEHDRFPVPCFLPAPSQTMALAAPAKSAGINRCRGIKCDQGGAHMASLPSAENRRGPATARDLKW